MRFVLVGPTLEENLSIAYLAAALRRAGHEAALVSFVDDAQRAEAVTRILAAAPDAVGLSMTFQSRGRGFLALARDLRRRGFRGHLTAGGHWAAVAAEEVLRDHPAIDGILRGEAEDAIVALAGALAGGGDLVAVPGIVLRRDGSVVRGPAPHKRVDLDELPFPARDGPPRRLGAFPVAPLVASRGCRGSCAFCSIAAFGRLSVGPARRRRSPEDVVDEMAALWGERAVRVFIFHDDDFFEGRREEDLERFERMGRAMAARGLPRVALAVKARPDDIDEVVVRRLRDLGLVRVFLGVETDAPAGLRALARGVSPDANRRALAVLARLEVPVWSNLLLWEPDTTIDDLRRNVELMRAFPDQVFGLARTELYEGAPLTLRLAREGRLLGTYLGRDYVVSDPRAELAWRLFLVALGERSYAETGAIKTALGLAQEAALLRHFVRSPRAERLQAEASDLVRRLAGSTRAWVERIVEYAAVAPLGPEREIVTFGLAAARAVRKEDTELLATMRESRRACLRCGLGWTEAGEPEPERRRRGATGRAVSVAVAAAGLLACSKGTPAGHGATDARGTATAVDAAPPGAEAGAPAATDAAPVPAGETGGAPAGDVGAAPVPDAADAEPAVEPDSEVIAFTAGAPGSSEMYCRGARRERNYRLGIVLEDPSVDAQFDRLEASDGTATAHYISPDGRRASGEWSAGKERGTQRVTAWFRRAEEGARALRRTLEFFQYGDETATPGPEEQAEPECDIVCVDTAPPADVLLARSGPVIFLRREYEPTRAWADVLEFSVGLRAGVAGELVGEPEVSCTTGRAYVSFPGWGRQRPALAGEPSLPGLRDRADVSFSPQPPGADRPQLVAGDHSCTVTYRVRDGGRVKEYKGTLDVRIDPDGTVRIGPERGAPAGPEASLAPDGVHPARLRAVDGSPYPDLPLPLRYPVEVCRVEERSGVVVLEARCPGAIRDAAPDYSWHASAGEVEPLGDGSRARWRAAAGPAVVVCAVQSGPLDLQVGAWRRG